MSHALAVQIDPHLKFAHYVDAVLVGNESLDTKAIRIKSAAALYVGECQAREMRAYEAARTKDADCGGAMPRYVERHNPLAAEPPAVVPPSEPTTEFAPIAPDEPAPEPDATQQQPQPASDSPPAAADPADTTPIAKPKTIARKPPAARKPATTRPLPKAPIEP